MGNLAESAWLGADVIETAALRERVHGKLLVLHSANVSPVWASVLLTNLYELGITASNSSPRVSDDNAFIEPPFTTLKYNLRYPTGGFKCFDACRQWTQQFVQYYNGQHRHRGISWVTPLERHENLDVEILNRRSRVYAAARQANPNRWSGEERKWTHIKSVTLNGGKDIIQTKSQRN